MAAPSVALSLEGVSRSFGRRRVLESITARAATGEVLVIAGRNGSGKSTLLRIIAGILAPSAGTVRIEADAVPMSAEERRRRLGYVAPDLVLYRELSGVENLQFFAALRGIPMDRPELIDLLDRVGLRGRGRDLVAAYSSGMRQRLKYGFALMHRPPVLLLDEPTANLDAAGIEMSRRIVEEQRRQGLVVIATNDERERAWGDRIVTLDPL